MSTSELAARWCGRLTYRAGVELQDRHHAEVAAGGPPRVLLLEHDPVVTVSRRARASTHLLGSPVQLRRLGVAVEPTDRGGDVTLHTPGQVIVYPILNLRDFGLNLGSYMRALEAAVINTLRPLGLDAVAEAGATGVWIRRPGRSAAKVCAMGVRVRRHVTLHGLALNVCNDLSLFHLIDPCGLSFRPVTSLREEGLRDVRPRSIGDLVARSLRDQLARASSGSGV